MVLEMLINPRRAERSPWEMFFIGLVYSSVSIFLGFYIFRQYAGIVMVFLTTLACTYLIQGTLRREESKDAVIPHELALLKEHGKALSYFMFLFLGFVVAFSLWYVVLPHTFSSQLFNVQECTIQSINSGGAVGCVTSAATSADSFGRIFMNNIRVLMFVLLIAFFYGAGSVFILAWNATVIAAAIGSFVRSALSGAAATAGMSGIAGYFSSYSVGLMRYLTHGSLEILAYFIAALAGGIISVAVARHSFGSPRFRAVLTDSVDLIALSVGALFLAAVVEVFITPMIFG
ncbi:stage II sporulation protein M [Candidatus Woesearchaeota archaeon]|nr:stage II sporulation protein M [Candidatus Woesearchaeota archaeon]